MNMISKPWNWQLNDDSELWVTPAIESYYLAQRWRAAGFSDMLDFGCGLGRHAILFAKEGFRVGAFDLAPDGVAYLQAWARREKLAINVKQGDMLAAPFADAAFDCLLSYHVISHTNSAGFQVIMGEISRVLKPGGEFYITLCSKDTWSFKSAGYPVIDENTIVKTDDGPEKDVPHFYVDFDDIMASTVQHGLEVIDMRHTDHCYFDGAQRNSKHYFILGHKI